MREIKFRAWDGVRMTTGGISFCNSDGILSGKAYAKDGGEVFMPIMQFTGLKDKNGVDIYEGDILHSVLGEEIDQNFISVVRYGDELNKKIACFWVEDITCKGFSDGLTLQECSDTEIIGNIYENPSLIE